jgi:hypothetical protein
MLAEGRAFNARDEGNSTTAVLRASMVYYYSSSFQKRTNTITRQ